MTEWMRGFATPPSFLSPILPLSPSLARPHKLCPVDYKTCLLESDWERFCIRHLNARSVDKQLQGEYRQNKRKTRERIYKIKLQRFHKFSKTAREMWCLQEILFSLKEWEKVNMRLGIGLSCAGSCILSHLLQWFFSYLLSTERYFPLHFRHMKTTSKRKRK